MNENYPCEIIKDLLPGYIDGVLSETGVNVVKKHLEECDKCNQIYLEMEGELNAEISPEEQLALDGFKKVRQHTRKLKIAVGMVTGLLILLLLTIFLKIFVIGEPLSTHHITVTNLSYDEETGNLVINGMVNMDDYRVNRVVWKESAEDANAVNVIVYGADTLPFGQAKQDFTITIPDMKGKKAYFACPNYDQREVYNWKHYHYEKLIEMEEEIYSRFSNLDRSKDALIYSGGIESVNDVDGILFGVESVIGENATFWTFDDQLITDGDFESRDFRIWISLKKPYEILLYDSSTGEYTDDYSIID